MVKTKKQRKKPIIRRVRLVPRGDGMRVVMLGKKRFRRGDIYVRLLDAPWQWLGATIILFYLAANVLFAGVYLWIGDGIANARPGSVADAFFFSVQTMATIGYGNMAPQGLAANILVTIEALTGFGFFAVVTGLLFSKFSRPTARVKFSNFAVICPYNHVPHLMLRLANERGNRIVDAHIQVVVLINETTPEGHDMRRFYDLTPVRSRVPLLQLTWTVMHPIDKHSPLYGMTTDMLREREAEIIITLTGLDESLAQTIHARYSYIADEIVFDAVFADILRRTKEGELEVDYRRFHETKPFTAA